MEMKKFGVVGAGMMGAEIALCFAQAGHETVLGDIKMEFAENGKKRLEGVLAKRVAKGKMTQEQMTATMNNIIPTCTADSVAAYADCDLIVEAALEVFEVKSDIFRRLDEACKETTILASNTSSISITKLATAVSKARAPRFLGTHFNSPASIMKLVEVIPAVNTVDEVTEAVKDVLTAIGKEPVKCKDVVGFGLNRLFHCFYLEACRLVEEGVCSVEDVDKICLYGLGHPQGIFKLLDTLSLSLDVTVDKILFEAYGDRFRPSADMQRLVDAGHYGKKTGSGYYDWDENGKVIGMSAPFCK
ncbi:MAG: 3-hydroxyacyl-CoA dehydrogenase family protein [Oscillospiraceae bacterium]|nr:3-hydroxyacyl-CoA dehydrogenase family protein [Oscillospiraceae bacterium]